MRYLVFLLVLLAACRKEDITPIDFSKFTAVDVNGTVIGEPDPTDWTYDSVWTAKEKAFMNFNDAITVTDSAIGFVELSPAFPNPNDGLFLIGVNTGQACKMKMVCVNEQFQVLYYNARLFTGGPIVTGYDFRSLTAFHKNANYRFYYAFYNALDSMYYKGHGDVRIE